MRCTCCKKELSEESFSINPKTDEYYKRCNSCREYQKEYRREYYEQNKDKIKEKSREYYEQNKDKMKEHHKEYYEQNKDRRKEYYEQNKDKLKEYYEQNKDRRKEYIERNKDKIKEKSREYYELNKDKMKEYWKEYYEQNKDKLKEKRKEYYEQNKDRRKEYIERNKDIINEKNKKYKELNKDKIKEYQKEYREQNKDKIKEKNKEYRESNALYVSYKDKLVGVDYKCDEEGYLLIRCKYCNKWFQPTNLSVQNYIKAGDGTNNLYCSEGCKKSCPTYGMKKYEKGFRQNTSREVQPELRKLVLERDNWTCQKCGKSKDEDINLVLHCHHIDPVKNNPIESADMDNCVTLCKECHKEAHRRKGCRYSDLANCYK